MWARRLRTIPGVIAAAVLLTLFAPLWVPVLAIVDLVRLRRRLPTVRLVAFGWCFALAEVAGVGAAFGLWLVGQSTNKRLHYRLQRWWAATLVGALRATTGIEIEVVGADRLGPGPLVLLTRHASLADSLVSAYALTTVADLDPRYVLKRELLWDPCLDVVGHRIPNHFLDRKAPDPAIEAEQLRRLASAMGPRDVTVIFPEGTRANAQKRTAALTRIAESDPGRAVRLGGLGHLLPPRPAGAAALLDGAPDADVALAWHIGFDGLDTFGGILAHLSKRPPVVRFVIDRVPRATVGDGDRFLAWLDDTWLTLDRHVDHALHPEGPR